MEHKLEGILGYHFQQPTLLLQALTHGSVSYETQRSGVDNQRLEFLGDAVLQLILSEALYEAMPQADEGLLTKARANLVSAKSLAQLAREIHLGSHLHLGRGEEASGGRERESTLADALEAVIGSLYLDGGLEAARDFVLRLTGERVANAMPLHGSNPKGDLQEKLQAVRSEGPRYSILQQAGPDHAKHFEAAVHWLGHELGRGTGRSKKEAETAAAAAALQNCELERLLRETT
jgi:ribonuclease III